MKIFILVVILGLTLPGCATYGYRLNARKFARLKELGEFTRLNYDRFLQTDTCGVSEGGIVKIRKNLLNCYSFLDSEWKDYYQSCFTSDDFYQIVNDSRYVIFSLFQDEHFLDTKLVEVYYLYNSSPEDFPGWNAETNRIKELEPNWYLVEIIDSDFD